MDLLKKVEHFIEHEQLFHFRQKVLIAVSGGIDSMVLWHICKRLQIPLAIAHCNFQLREQESDDDEFYVYELASQNKDQIYIKRFETQDFALKNKYAIQEAARIVRYKWFEQLLQENQFDYILTAHHADDNVETMLMNFFKGTGINGLKGILPKNGKICRPLLFATREEIVLYAKENKILFREDSSNLSEKYTRNFYRHSVIPALNQLIPGVSGHLIHQTEKFRDIKIIYDEFCKAALQKLIEIKPDGHYIPVLKLLKSPAHQTMIYEFSVKYGFNATQTSEIEKLLHAPSGKYILSSTHRILRNRKWLIISPVLTVTPKVLVIEDQDTTVETDRFKMKIIKEDFDGNILKENTMVQLDLALIQFPLLLRKWKQGDYFYPLGMKKKKKISRFLIDQKLSTLEKEQTWVLESNKKIIWLVGLRLDDRYRISPETKKIVRLQLVPKN